MGVAAVGTATVASLPKSLRAATSTALFAAAGTALYVGWYGRYGRTPSPALEIGRRLPTLELRLADGTTFSTDQLAGARAALFFTRGNWCPFCTAQVQELVAGYNELAARGVKVVVVAPQPDDETQALGARFGVDIVWASDPELRAATALGVHDPGGVPFGVPSKWGLDTVMPTVVVVDAEQRVVGVAATDGFRTRPDASVVLDILERPLTAAA